MTRFGPLHALTRAAALRTQTGLALLLTAVLAAVALTAWPLLDEPRRIDGVHLSWLLLAGMFALTESVVLHIQVRREAQAVSLSEFVLVLALFFAAPWEVLLGRALGSLLVLVVVRRSSLLKCTFNLVLFAAETAVALHVFALLAGPGGSPGPREWLAAYVAVLVGGALTIFSLQLVVAVYEGGFGLRAALREAVLGQPASIICTTLALVAVLCLALDERSSWLLLAAAAGLLAAYRTYATLSDRHQSLERLYGFSQVVTRSPEVDTVLRSVLGEAKQLLRAEHVDVRFLPDATTPSELQVRLVAGGRLQRSELDRGEDPPWIRQILVDEGQPVFAGRGSRDEQIRAWLAREAYREAIVVPLRGEHGVVGSIRVADRLGEVRAFDSSDVRLLETVANHASVALRNGHLIDQLRHDALHDALTGLPNRVALQRALAEAVADVSRGAAAGAAVMILDLDGFKDVNDTLGHAAGDRLLQAVAHRLVEAVGTSGLVARLGGDEFAIVLPAASDVVQVRDVGDRVLNALHRPIPLDALEVEVGASIGAVLAPLHGLEVAELLKRADMAMYGAKGSTGGLRLYQTSLDTDDPRRLTLVGELRSALQDGLLEVHVQPKVALRDGGVSAVEALVRWDHPELGQVTPDELVPVAERTGLIEQLTTLVLERALEGCAGWRRDGLHVGVAVNLSTRSLLDPDLVPQIGDLLARHELPGSALTLEITEGSVMLDPDRAVVLLSRLRELGVRLSLDDFGTGYSSLAYLTRIPVHEIKIDKSFVLRLLSQPHDAAVVRSILELGLSLGLQVVAEGVEDAATAHELARMGCPQAQGWHFAPAMPLSELAGWLQERRTREAVSAG